MPGRRGGGEGVGGDWLLGLGLARVCAATRQGLRWEELPGKRLPGRGCGGRSYPANGYPASPDLSEDSYPAKAPAPRHAQVTDAHRAYPAMEQDWAVRCMPGPPGTAPSGGTAALHCTLPPGPPCRGFPTYPAKTTSGDALINLNPRSTGVRRDCRGLLPRPPPHPPEGPRSRPGRDRGGPPWGPGPSKRRRGPESIPPPLPKPAYPANPTPSPPEPALGVRGPADDSPRPHGRAKKPAGQGGRLPIYTLYHRNEFFGKIIR